MVKKLRKSALKSDKSALVGGRMASRYSTTHFGKSSACGESATTVFSSNISDAVDVSSTIEAVSIRSDDSIVDLAETLGDGGDNSSKIRMILSSSRSRAVN